MHRTLCESGKKRGTQFKAWITQNGNNGAQNLQFFLIYIHGDFIHHLQEGLSLVLWNNDSISRFHDKVVYVI